jgi:hypothetical protein
MNDLYLKIENNLIGFGFILVNSVFLAYALKAA